MQEPVAPRVVRRASTSRSVTTRSQTSQDNSSSPSRPVSEQTSLPPIPENIMSTAAASMSTVPGTTVVPSVPHIPMSTRKMPKPSEKNAPSFDLSKPEELSQFFKRIEDWFSDENISDDDDKKRRIVRYLDLDSEVQWKALPSSQWEPSKSLRMK